MVNERSAEDELAELLGWTEAVTLRRTWADVESEYGLTFPSDFKRLMSRFPSGAFASRFYVYSPAQNQAAATEYRDYWDLDRKKLAGIRDGSGRAIPTMVTPYPLHPEPGGIIPWGSGDEHTYYWRTTEVNKPDEWTVVYTDRFCINWGEYDGTMSAFLLDLITGQFQDVNLYYEPTESERHFRPFEDDQ